MTWEVLYDVSSVDSLRGKILSTYIVWTIVCITVPLFCFHLTKKRIDREVINSPYIIAFYFVIGLFVVGLLSDIYSIYRIYEEYSTPDRHDCLTVIGKVNKIEEKRYQRILHVWNREFLLYIRYHHSDPGNEAILDIEAGDQVRICYISDPKRISYPNKALKIERKI